MLELISTEHPVGGLLLRHTHIRKLRSAYTTGLLDKIHRNGRVYTHFNQSGGFAEAGRDTEAPATGRLSSSGPNLMQVPKHDPPTGPFIAKTIRRAFVAEPGRTLVVGDVAQEEFRIGTWRSGDTAMQTHHRWPTRLAR